MRIDGITSCVNERYASYLLAILPVWRKTLDSIVVVTDQKTLIVAAGVTVIRTDAFTAGGAHFNKGAALNEAYAALAPTDWILSFDCDTKPPWNWRTLAARVLEPGNLYGAKRHAVNRPFLPYGYFQLWHTSDRSPPSPPFATCYGHAGRYDGVFLEHWPADRRRRLPFRLKHYGKPRRDWFGVGNEHLTAELFRNGVAAYREQNAKIGRQ